MALSFITPPAANFLVENPIIFRLASDSPDAIRFTVSIAGDEVYAGIFLPAVGDGFHEADLSLSGILQAYFTGDPVTVDPEATVSEVLHMYLDFSVLFTRDSDALLHNARAYRGGVSKDMLRWLDENNTDIFTCRLLSSVSQFFMTSRTASREITVKENELMPLFFIASGRSWSVTTEHGDSFAFPPAVQGEVYAFNLRAFRESLPRPPFLISLKLLLTLAITVRIVEPDRTPRKLMIEFINSFGAPERMEISGKCTSVPDFGDETAFDVYDAGVDGYIERCERAELREVIRAESGYRTADEFRFLRDLLQSDRRWLIDLTTGRRRQIRVTAESFEHDLFPVTPGSATLTLRCVEAEKMFSPDPTAAGDSGTDEFFIATYEVGAAALTAMLPFAGSVSLTVDWGDGTAENVAADYPAHTYAAPGSYTVAAAGHADRMTQPLEYYNPARDNYRKHLTAVESFGNLGLTYCSYAFYLCPNLRHYERKPKFFRTVTYMDYMFFDCTSITYTFEETDAPAVLSAQYMYAYCTSLQEVAPRMLSGMPALQMTIYMFYKCTAIRSVPEELLSRNTALTDIRSMFRDCTNLENGLRLNGLNSLSQLDYLYADCTSLSSLEEACFEGLTVQAFYYVFMNCKALRSVPHDIFADTAAALSFEGLFQGAGLESVPENLFAGNPAAVSFRNAFAGCSLTAVPVNLFAANPAVTDFSATFAGCPLAAVPENLFRYNTAAADFSSVLSSTAIAQIPVNLFRYNANAKNFSSAFAGCAGLTSVGRIFDHIANLPDTRVDYCFSSSGIQTVDPQLFACLTQMEEIHWVFASTQALTQIPDSIFAQCVNLKQISHLFDASHITSVPESLFAACTLVTRMWGVFRDSQLEQIPPALLAANTQLTNMTLMFQNAKVSVIPGQLYASLSLLESVDSNFSYSPVTAIPQTLFQNCTSLKTLQNEFNNCLSLTAIPDNLFDGCEQLETVSGVFANCHQLTAIPDHLLDGCEQFKNVTGLFANCTKLTAIPGLLFDPCRQISVFNGVFQGCYRMAGMTPRDSNGLALWERAGQPGYPASVAGYGCFQQCTQLTEYGSIPYYWKNV